MNRNITDEEEYILLKEYAEELSMYDSLYNFSGITRENSHEVARSLYFKDNKAAEALYEELKYWVRKD